MERWRENNQTPAVIEAYHVANNRVDMTRPLCPYPQVAVHAGSGSTDEAANFARIPRLAGYASSGPGQGIQLLLCYHDLAQVEPFQQGLDEGGTDLTHSRKVQLSLPVAQEPVQASCQSDVGQLLAVLAEWFGGHAHFPWSLWFQ